MENTSMTLHSLITEVVHTPESPNERTTYSYQFHGLFTQTKPTKQEKLAGVTPISIPMDIPKARITAIFVALADNENELSLVDYGFLVRLSERKIPGIAAWVNETAPMQEDNPEWFRAVLSSLVERFKELEVTPSVADPDLEVKREFCKAGPFHFLEVAEDPSSIVIGRLNLQINYLEDLKARAALIPKADYIERLTHYFRENGVDENGVVKLRNTQPK